MKRITYLYILLFLIITNCLIKPNNKKLLNAVKKNNFNKIEKLLDNGININAQDKSGKSALLIACLRGYTDIAELLLKKGANINFRDNQGNTALIIASENGNNEIIKLLINNKINIDSKNFNSDNALHKAVLNGHLDTVKILINNNADINIKNKYGNTPLILCIDNDRFDILKLLIENKADIFLRNNKNLTAYQTAILKNQLKSAEFLELKADRYSFLMKDLVSYKTILKSDIKPGLKPQYKFPCTKQPKYECFGYAVKHIVKYKYDIDIDVIKSDKITGRNTDWGWNLNDIKNFLQLHKLEIDSRYTANELFSFLMQGEPVIIWYKISKNWGHWVSAYSFDNNGIWISESITNKRICIPYNKIFESDGINCKGSFMVIKKKIN